ncbi:MAG: NADPH-dependent F420 reductase [Pseudomonadota bacterium]
MKIGILGAGNVGSKLADLMRNAGHDVLVGSRSGPHSLADAAEYAEIVVIAIHFHATTSVLPELAPLLSGKVVIDATNPLNDDWSPLLLGQENSASEEIARLLPDAHVVKAFNTIFADVMAPDRQEREGSRVTCFIASDHADAVLAVAGLAEDMGFAPVTVSKLSAARQLEAIAHLNIELALGQGGGTNAAFLYHRQ